MVAAGANIVFFDAKCVPEMQTVTSMSGLRTCAGFMRFSVKVAMPLCVAGEIY